MKMHAATKTQYSQINIFYKRNSQNLHSGRIVKQMQTMDTKSLCPHCKVLYSYMTAVIVLLLLLVLIGAQPC